jgi:hypothetical protein
MVSTPALPSASYEGSSVPSRGWSGAGWWDLGPAGPLRSNGSHAHIVAIKKFTGRYRTA